MLKKGFTLAEVLVTLTIVGVVAALASPVLVGAFQKSKVGPSLRKFMNTIETANQHILGDYEAAQIDNVVSSGSEYFTLLSKYVSGSPAMITKDVEKTDEDGAETVVKETTIKTIKDISIPISSISTVVTPAVVTNYPDENSIIYTMAGGEEFALNYAESASENVANGGYKGEIAKIYFDINGFEVGPNKVAKDIFWFVLDNNGSLIPYGGRAYANAYGNEVLWKESITGCKEDLVAGFGAKCCSGSIADNNWKVIYKY